jgi:uncharacterized protein (TIGR03067 family)
MNRTASAVGGAALATAVAIALLVLCYRRELLESLWPAAETPVTERRQTPYDGPVRGGGEPSQKVKDELSRLRGFWMVSSAEWAGAKRSLEWSTTAALVADDQWTFLHPRAGLPVGPSTIRIDPDATPKRIDLGAGRDRRLGIYSIEGDMLLVCWAAPEEPRPVDFSTRRDGQRVMLTLKRLPKPLPGDLSE